MEGCLSEVQNSPSPQAAHASKLPSLLDSPRKLPRQTSGSQSRGGSSNRSSTKGKAYELCNSPTPQQLAALRSTSASPTPRKAFHSRQGSRNGSRNQSRKFLQQGEASSSSRSFQGQSRDADKGDANSNCLLAAVESALLDRPSFSDRESGNSGDDTCSESGRIDLETAREKLLSEPSECTSQRPSFLSSRLTGRCNDEFQKNNLRGSFGERATSFGNRSSLQSFGMRGGSFQRDSLGQRGNSFHERGGSFQRDSLGERGSGCHERGGPFQISLAESLCSGKVADWSDPDCKDDVDNLGHPPGISVAQRSGTPLREFRRLPCLKGPQPSMGQMVASARSLLAQRRPLRRTTFGKDQSRYMSAPAGLESAEAAARSSKSDVNQPPCHDERPASACKASFQSPTTASDAHSPKRDDTEPLPVRAAAVVAAAVASAVTRTPMATLTASTTVTSLSSQKAPDEKLRIRHDKQPVVMESHAVAGEPCRTPQVPETPSPKRPTSRPGRTWVCGKQYTECG